MPRSLPADQSRRSPQPFCRSTRVNHHSRTRLAAPVRGRVGDRPTIHGLAIHGLAIHRFAVCSLLVSSLLGCGPTSKTVPIRGQVTYQGKPLSQGTIMYVPRDRAAGRQARGEIKSDGSFELTTFQPGDGALIGDYDIAIVSLKAHPGEPSREEIEAMGGIIQRGSAIPERYGDPSSSGLSDSVDRDHAGIKNFELSDE